MTDNENSSTVVAESSQRKTERSAAYPAITIEEALKHVGEIYKNFRKDYAKRDDIISLLEGVHFRHIAAAAYYELLQREKDSYKVSELYIKISQPLNNEERNTSLLKAFKAPALYKQLIEKFNGAEIPPELTFHLTRFFRITTDAAPLAAEVFRKNAIFCRALDEKNILNVDRNFSESVDEILENKEGSPKVEATNEIGIQHKNETLTPSARTEEKQQLLLPDMVNKEEVKIRLTNNRYAILIYPKDIVKKDVQILSKQIEQLELLVE